MAQAENRCGKPCHSLEPGIFSAEWVLSSSCPMSHIYSHTVLPVVEYIIYFKQKTSTFLIQSFLYIFSRNLTTYCPFLHDLFFVLPLWSILNIIWDKWVFFFSFSNVHFFECVSTIWLERKSEKIIFFLKNLSYFL